MYTCTCVNCVHACTYILQSTWCHMYGRNATEPGIMDFDEECNYSIYVYAGYFSPCCLYFPCLPVPAPEPALPTFKAAYPSTLPVTLLPGSRLPASAPMYLSSCQFQSAVCLSVCLLDLLASFSLLCVCLCVLTFYFFVFYFSNSLSVSVCGVAGSEGRAGPRLWPDHAALHLPLVPGAGQPRP